jgi:putative DNA primase/helicase
LLDTLKAESAHILSWMVEGCLSWQKKGLHDVPATIRAATGDYQVEQDLIGRWISECCDVVAVSETPSKELYKNYSGWCFDNGLRPASNIALGRKLSERGFGCKRSNGNSIWTGLAIARPDFQETVPHSMYD